jgi:hypothetical protein
MLGKTLTPEKGPVTHAVFEQIATLPTDEHVEGD